MAGAHATSMFSSDLQTQSQYTELIKRYFLYTRTRIGYFYHRREIAKAREKYSDGHSVPTITEFDGLSILPVAMMEDNYAYLIIDTKTQKTVVVDPGDPQPVKTAIEERHLSPVAVLTTHKHWDHSGGNSEMRQLYPGIQVYGGAMDHVPAITHPVADGDVLEFGPMKFTAKFTPGHTVGHVVYVLDGLAFGAPDSLFSGDHLFLSGCGRMFECSAGTMLRSFDSLQSLPDTTLVWPGHEYAIDNLEFTIHIDPDNEAAQAKQKWSKAQRSNKLCTCPSTMGEEKQYNPFLRTNSDSLLQSLGMIQSEDADRDHIRSRALAEIRERKDNFKYKL